MRPTIAKIYLNNLIHNINQIRSNIRAETKICVAVKADAYGHGIVQCAEAAQSCNVDYVSVATTDEAVLLRASGYSGKILMLDLTTPEDMNDLVKCDVEPFVFDYEYIDLLSECAKSNGIKKVLVHLPVDTGMGRVGCLPEEAADIARAIESTGVLKLNGVCTHFAAADSVQEEDRIYTKKQIEKFNKAVENIRSAGINPGIIHCSSSAASLDLSDVQFDMCRPGIVVYGYYPGDMTEKYFLEKGITLNLKPVMCLETQVVAVRKFTKGMSVSYAHTWTAQEDTKIAVLPLGYEDGLFRRFAQNGLNVTIKGKNYPVVGRICMDQCMINLGSDSDVKRWDRAVIFGGKDQGALQSAQDIADATSTISYEITCGISKRVPRVYIR